MEATAIRPAPAEKCVDWLDIARELGPRFADRAAAVDEEDLFVGENFAELKACGLTAAGVPAELGGGGATHAELAAILLELAQHCGSTALAFAMHTHQVAIAAWRWKHQKAPVEGLLKRVAAERLVLLSSGGSDWLYGSGSATRVDGGFRVNARKVFVSGAPAGDLLMTSAVHEDPEAGPTVLHFAVPMKAAGVEIVPTWRALGMRGTGSHDVALTDVFVADAGISGRRPQGKWHPLFHIISMLAFPLVYAVYVGVAQAARDAAVREAAKRRTDDHLVGVIGGIENELAAARLALAEMLAAASTDRPGFEVTNRVMIGRALAARSVLKVGELALEAAGGGGFYRSRGLERLFRDLQAARFHPLQDGAQRDYAGRTALGLEVRA
jgi:alkylation response protein AidB-like acyl-CoA dehydrogenase